MPKATYNDASYLLTSDDEYESYGLSMPTTLVTHAAPNTRQPANYQNLIASLTLAKLKGDK